MDKQKIDLEQIKHNIYVIRLLAKRDRQRGNSSALLGQMWQIINPFINMIVMALIFTDMFGNKNFVNFPIYILVGTMIYTPFAEGTFSCLTALSGNKNFLVNSSISRSLYPIEKVYVAFVNFGFSAIIFVFVAIYYGIKPKLEWVLIIPNLILLFLFILGVGKILSIINVLFADITYFYRIFRLFVFYASGLFYDTSRLSPFMQKVISLNPIYESIAIARICLIDGQLPSITLWIKLFIYTLFFYILGTYIYNKNVNNMVDKI